MSHPPASGLTLAELASETGRRGFRVDGLPVFSFEGLWGWFSFYLYLVLVMPLFLFLFFKTMFHVVQASAALMYLRVTLNL